ncbi:phosphotriesterase family protein, partial [Patulibacter sp. S7RM1-6]
MLGAIPADALGRTSMHDHVLSDCRILHRAAAGAPERVSAQTAPVVGRAALATADNLVLDDEAAAVDELGAAAAGGLDAIVDLTSWGPGEHHARLPAIARATGLRIVAGFGVYLDRPHPAWVGELDDDALTARFVAALDDHVPGAAHRAAILGVIGTGSPVTPGEARVVAAVGRAVA